MRERWKSYTWFLAGWANFAIWVQIGMTHKPTFPKDVVTEIHNSKILGLRAGSAPHRFIGVWVVVVEGRVFVRSWSLKPRSWYRTFLEDPVGAINLNGREFPVRAIQTRSERLKDAATDAYREKYNTLGSVAYVRDMSKGQSRESTTELVPAQVKRASKPGRRKKPSS
jgi:hypothetical protein